MDVSRGLVLAGRASGGSGADERLLTLGGRPLVLRALDALRGAVPRVAVCVGPGDTLDLGDAADAQQVEADGGGSPLACVVAGLRRFREPLVVAPATAAFPQAETIRELLRHASGVDDVVLPAVEGAGQPLFAVYHPRCLPELERLVSVGRHDITEALPALSVHPVPFADGAPFAVVDSEEDWEAARRLVKPEAQGQPPLVAIVAKSGSGKTTFIEKLLPELVRLGLRVGTIKHDAHDFEIDYPGKDTYRHGAAGAEAYVISSAHRLAYVSRQEKEHSLADLARRFHAGMDLVLVEGYKREAPHKVELFRKGSGHVATLYGPDETMALITDDPEKGHEILFALDDAAALAAFLVVRLESLRNY